MAKGNLIISLTSKCGIILPSSKWPLALWGLQVIMLSLSFFFYFFQAVQDRVAEKDVVHQEQETTEEKLFLYLALWQLFLL